MRKMIEHVYVYGMAESIVASGYPMRTTNKSFEDDVKIVAWGLDTEKTDGFRDFFRGVRLGTAPMGSGHDNYLKGIIAQFDMTASEKLWTQAQRYGHLDYVSSMSVMHKGSKMDIEKCVNKYVDTRIIEILKTKQQEYNDKPTEENFLSFVYNIPSGFLLTARMTTNYQQLKTIWYQRNKHRLPEWRRLCREIEQLPYFKMLCIRGDLNE